MSRIGRIFLALLIPTLLFARSSEDACGYIFDDYPPLYYPASTHYLIEVSALGDSVELEDGSIWKICHYDGYKAMQWRSNDPLIITQNHRWFSSYPYRIVNQNSGESLETTLFVGPLEYGQNTLYITDIDRLAGDLSIVNGSGEVCRWKIFSNDLSLLQNWAVHDAIIIGQNSGWDTDFEALLINVTMNHSVRARQI